jgi:oxysterol-binding protein-related protein 8
LAFANYAFPARLWSDLTKAIKSSDMEAAGIAKSKVEDAQRERVKAREASGETHKLRFFMPVGEKFMPVIDIDRWETFCSP